MFKFADQPINAHALKDSLTNPRAGAVVTFEGLVRNHSEGRSVVALSYEAFQALAIKEGNRIIEQARAQFQIYDAVCVHRVGDLSIGDMAVWVGVSSAHRGTAFDACRFIIDEIKQRVPIWKKETYTDGTSGWVNCQACSSPSHAVHQTHKADTHESQEMSTSDAQATKQQILNENEFYSRQTILAKIGQNGQQKLKDARVLVIGAGGLGSSALMYLCGAGVGSISVCDFDVVSQSNLHRQTLFNTDDIGLSKASQAARKLSLQNPFVTINAVKEKLSSDNATELFKAHDVVLDCSDNFATKFLCNDTALSTGTALIQASIHQFEGQLQLIHKSGDTLAGQCLRCLWPETSAEDLSCIGSCAEAGVLGVVPGVFGCLQASETLKYILGLETELRANVILFDLLTCSTRKIKRRVVSSCQCQSGNAKPEAVVNIEIDFAESATFDPTVVIDVRETSEIGETENLKLHWPASRYLNVPLSRFDSVLSDLESKTGFGLETNNGASPETCAVATVSASDRILVLCARGQRSMKASLSLRKYCPFVFSLKGGLASLSHAPLAQARAHE